MTSRKTRKRPVQSLTTHQLAAIRGGGMISIPLGSVSGNAGGGGSGSLTPNGQDAYLK